MKFKHLQLNDVENILTILLNQKTRICDYTIGSLFIWGSFFKYQFCIQDSFLYIKGITLDDQIMFSPPIGDGDFKHAVETLRHYCAINNIPLIFYNVPIEQVEQLKQYYLINPILIDDWFDYLYSIEDLYLLKGKKYQAKRNHINKFKNLYPNYKSFPITISYLDKIKQFNQKFISDNQVDDPILIKELAFSLDLIPLLNKLNLVSCLILVDDIVVAYAIGEIINDTLYVHMEKADKNYHGSYALINLELIRHNYDSNIKYINREEDIGNPNLRKAKESYHPIQLLYRYKIDFN